MTSESIDKSKTGVETLSDETLDRVAGGLNPQPLPPRAAFGGRTLMTAVSAQRSVSH